MKRILLIGLVGLLAGGCASSATTDRLDALERQLGTVQRTASEALALARDAQSSGSDAAAAAARAEDLAQAAMDTADETAERMQRMQQECCQGK